MIQANELRLGNLVEAFGIQCKIIELCKNEAHLMPISQPNIFSSDYEFYLGIDPITLTEEWLLKAGFEVTVIETQIWSLEVSSDKVIQVIDFSRVRLWNNQNYYKQSFDYLWGTTEYVHQLQNLYFALTGKELEFKL